MPEEQKANDVDQSHEMSEQSESLGPAPGKSSEWLKIGILFVALGVLMYVVINPIRPSGMDGVNHPAVGSQLQDIDLRPLTFEGGPVRIDDLRGKVVMLNYWGTWCPPCRVEFPHVVQLNKRFRDDDDFLMLSVSCLPGLGGDSRSLKNETASYLRSQEADFPAYSDLQGNSRRALMRVAELDSFGFPTTLILDRDNSIQGFWQGYRKGSEDEMEQLIDELLNKA